MSDFEGRIFSLIPIPAYKKKFKIEVEKYTIITGTLLNRDGRIYMEVLRPKGESAKEVRYFDMVFEDDEVPVGINAWRVNSFVGSNGYLLLVYEYSP